MRLFCAIASNTRHKQPQRGPNRSPHEAKACGAASASSGRGKKKFNGRSLSCREELNLEPSLSLSLRSTFLCFPCVLSSVEVVSCQHTFPSHTFQRAPVGAISSLTDPAASRIHSHRHMSAVPSAEYQGTNTRLKPCSVYPGFPVPLNSLCAHCHWTQ
ncbi:uncharacterized protein J3D65DRAFT_82899 [Phyllosticta citribraziliensis]|uniref:Uncharacterized protein n=1 Tax=Phyllosticta citribraziliensis TaxID=989973 RepID=A0ABR1LBK3_9PEZI